VSALGSRIINSGTITAGSGASTAVLYQAGANNAQFEMQNGSTITGNVDARAINSATLVVGTGVLTQGTFNVSAIGTQYLGFNSFVKEGANNTLTLMASNSGFTPWTINEGILAISNDNQLGASSNALTFGSKAGNTGTLTVNNSTLSSRNIVLLDNGSINVASAQTYQNSAVVSGAFDLTKQGDGTLTLAGLNAYTGATNVTSIESVNCCKS
jgi:autotransporter-associated beta strand protein